jgi:hypothetical protein
MQIGSLYFVKDEFYERFKDYGLLENKIIVDGKEHNRPCCYLFKFKENNEDIYWLIPISSQVTKYEEQYQRSMEKYGMCDNISFGYVLGERCAFLPQNLFPVTKEYINNVLKIFPSVSFIVSFIYDFYLISIIEWISTRDTETNILPFASYSKDSSVPSG